VLDGCSAMMLSGETAVGRHPIQSVSTMRRITEVALEHARERTDLVRTSQVNLGSEGDLALTEAIAVASRALPITKIVAVTVSGYAARVIAATRPRQPILAVTNAEAAARCFNLFFGTEGVFIDTPFDRTSTGHIGACLHHLWRTGRIVADDVILVTALAYPGSGSRMNLIETHHVEDLARVLEWHA